MIFNWWRHHSSLLPSPIVQLNLPCRRTGWNRAWRWPFLAWTIRYGLWLAEFSWRKFPSWCLPLRLRIPCRTRPATLRKHIHVYMTYLMKLRAHVSGRCCIPCIASSSWHRPLEAMRKQRQGRRLRRWKVSFCKLASWEFYKRGRVRNGWSIRLFYTQLMGIYLGHGVDKHVDHEKLMPCTPSTITRKVLIS